MFSCFLGIIYSIHFRRSRFLEYGNSHFPSWAAARSEPTDRPRRPTVNLNGWLDVELDFEFSPLAPYLGRSTAAPGLAWI